MRTYKYLERWLIETIIADRFVSVGCVILDIPAEHAHIDATRKIHDTIFYIRKQAYTDFPWRKDEMGWNPLVPTQITS